MGFAGIIALQIVLSRREKWWPELILPALWLIWTLAVTVPQVVSLIKEGCYLWFTGAVDLGMAALAMENVPNLILLAIYWAAREKRRTGAQMEKMGTQDIGEL